MSEKTHRHILKALSVADGKDHHWLNRERLRNYPVIFFFCVYFILTCGWVMTWKHPVVMTTPLGYDFITFWAASHLGLAGHPAAAYDIASIFKIERTLFPTLQRIYVWYYPPSFFLLILPLGLLPYLVAYWVFAVTTLACFLAVFSKVVRHKTAWCYLAAFSGLWMNLYHGQNGFLTGAIAGAALLSLPRRPVLAGVFIGLLAIKPHLGLLFPIALAAIGAWRAFITAALVSVSFMAVGTAALGMSTLKACLTSLRYARGFLEGGILPWAKMPTVFAFMRLLGAPISTAYAVHAMVALCAIFCVWHVWHHSGNWPLRGAILMTATFMVSPYVFDYDLAWLAFPIAWLSLDGLQQGWLRGEREVLVAAWLLPVLMSFVAAATSVQIAPFVLGALVFIIVRRARQKPLKGSYAGFPAASQILAIDGGAA